MYNVVIGVCLRSILEVMGAVVKARGYTWEELTQIRKAKREKRGAFDKRIYLKEVLCGTDQEEKLMPLHSDDR